ncbi:MAG: TonB-dependent receptor plug domain-containing protein [Opitutales bacterium]|nr:TonB-dependent receptor plug domain-containing protein [Opitutales bacterium]
MTPKTTSRISHQGRRIAALLASLSIASVAWSQDPGEDVFELSPFAVVTSESDIGYHAENTLAGSRLNTNVSDLASSITIVTRQQLEDTGALDINDIFLYEANTEGVGNYTEYSIDRGGVKDHAAGYNHNGAFGVGAATSNRIRGLAAADTAQNNHPTISRMPFDEYNTQTVEINRGPNSLIFGLGSPAGIVNQSTANAVLNVRNTEVAARYGSWGAKRFSFNHNQPIIDDMLSIYIAAVDDQRGFRRKPSYDDTQRQYGAFTFQPFQHTVIRGSIERYRNQNRRPNYITPRERITNWIADGRPTYNPVSRMVTYQNGNTVGPFTRHVESPGAVLGIGDDHVNSDPDSSGYGNINMGNALGDENSALFVRSLVFNGGDPELKVNPDGSFYYIETHHATQNDIRPPVYDDDGNRVMTDEQHMIYDRALMHTRWPQQPLREDGSPVMQPWFEPPLTDPDLFDFHHVNINAVNFGEMWGRTYNLELEQRIAENLYFSAGWFRQHIDTLETRPLAQQAPITIMVDVNSHLPDGSENPNFLSPYIDDWQSDTARNPEASDSWRAMLAYSLDLTDRNDFLRNAGRHRFLGFASRHDAWQGYLRARQARIAGDERWAPSPPRDTENWTYALNSSRVRRHYYIGSDAQVNQANPGIANPGVNGGGGPTEYTLRTYDWETENWYDAPVIMNTEISHAGTGRTRRVIDSYNFAWQGYFWDERIVTTLGWRRDEYKARRSDGWAELPEITYTAGRFPNPREFFHRWTDWENITGTTSTRGIVFKPFRWSGGEFSLHYNESDNFNPPPAPVYDWYGNSLPKPAGEGKDYGFGVTLFGGVLYARVNWFETTDANERHGTDPWVWRTQRMDTDFFRDWATMVVRIRSGEDPESEDFARFPGTEDHLPLTPAQEEQVADIMGLAYDWPQGTPPVGATQNTTAEGMEIQVTYNPMRNWNMKLTVGKQETVRTNVAPEWDPWVEERMDVWTSTTANDMPESFQLRGGDRTVRLRNFWSADGYRGDLTPENQWHNVTSDWWDVNVQSAVDFIRLTEGRVTTGQRKWRANFITNYRFVDGFMQGFTFGGGIRWQDKSTIGYMGYDRSGNGTLDTADLSRPVFDSAQFHLDLWASYSRLILDERVRMTVQLNVRDVTENGSLQPIAVNYDGSPYAYRIVDPRQVFITTRFEF